MPSHIQPRSKYLYLLSLRAKAVNERTHSEQHELDQARIAYGPEWWKSGRQLVWEARAREVGAFHRASGRWPSVNATEPVEVSVGQWLSNARAYSKKGAVEWSVTRVAYLDEVAPGWRGDDPEGLWRRSADELAEFRRAQGRWPSTAAKDDVQKRLGGWLKSTRAGSKNGGSGWTADRGAYLDAVAPGWRGENPETVWRRVADEVAEFQRAHGHWPRHHVQDPAERRLGSWLINTRHASKDATRGWTVDRGAYLDAVAPGWRGSRRAPARWHDVADELVQFRCIAGRWPSSEAEDEVECRLGRWISNCRYQIKKGVDGWADRGTYLDKVAPGWRGEDHEVLWRGLADEVAEFRRTHERWPGSEAKDPAEKRLGTWCRTTRGFAKKGTGGWTADRGSYLDSVAPGWRREDPEILWRRIADEVAAFHRAHARWPRAAANAMAESRLGMWLNGTRMSSKNGTRGWTEARGAYLDEVAPAWRGEDPEVLWRRIADEVAAFHRAHERWPSAAASDPAEVHLSRWLYNTRWRSKSRVRGWSAERDSYLDVVAPDWRNEDPEMRWRQIANEVAEFYRTNGRWPSAVAVESKEKFLGSWLHRNRKSGKKVTNGSRTHRISYLDEVAPGWRGRRYRPPHSAM